MTSASPGGGRAGSETVEPLGDRGELGGGVARRIGPDGEVSSIIDLLEGTKVFLPVECPGRQARTTEGRDPPGGGRRGIAGVRVRDPGAEAPGRGDRVDLVLDQGRRVDAGDQ